MGLVGPVAAPAVALGHGIGLGVHGVALDGGIHPLAPGSGLEGQWIPDINEKLYDDGQYRGELIGHLGHGW